jgi:hypothetical protein
MMSVNVYFVLLDETCIPVTILTECQMQGYTFEVVQTNQVQNISHNEVIEVSFCFSTSTVFVDHVFGV